MQVACFFMPQFGIACERARLSHLQDRPVALADGEEILQAVSDEAFARGIQVGQSASSARSLCFDLVVLPYDALVYESSAQCVWDAFAVESSVVEPCSPEVCFVEMTGPDILERIRGLALAITTRIHSPVMTGVATTKFVARQASLQDRDGGCVVVPPGHEAVFLAPLALDRVGEIDVRLRQRLERLGVKTFRDVLNLPPRLLQKRFASDGLLLYRLSVGEDGNRVKPCWPPRRIEERVNFETEVMDEGTVREGLSRCARRIARELSQGREFCRTLALRVGLADGSFLEQGEKLAVPLDDAGGIQRAGQRLLGRLRIDRPIVDVTLCASDLGAGSGLQLSLLEDMSPESRARLVAVMHFLRKRFPLSAPVLASVLHQSRRIGLWTYPLGYLLEQPVEVAIDAEGRPVRYWGRRHRREYCADVLQVHTRWKETEWIWGSVSESLVWRVETDPCGLCDLHHSGLHWKVGAVAD
jgi:nucleotidyltransferase/DNA polymerase involved in DNA repair